MTEPSARVIADSINGAGHRVMTIEAVMHRYVLAEFNTHRMFSRNSASSRAIPLSKQMGRVHDDPAVPVVFPAEQKGMLGGDEIEHPIEARNVWLAACVHAMEAARFMGELGVHKSVANRLLEPFMWHTVVVTATEWDGFWEQRCSPLAQPEIRATAEAMKAAYNVSEPVLLQAGEWHLPYVDLDTWGDLSDGVRDEEEWMLRGVKVSAARCARVSYLTQGGQRDWHEDITLYDRLTSANPMHASPLEHACTPHIENEQTVCVNHRHDHLSENSAEVDLSECKWVTRPRYGNFVGWHQHRYDVDSGGRA